MSNMSFRGSRDRLGQDFNKSEKGEEAREDRLKHGDEAFSVLPVISSGSVLMREPGADVRRTDDVIQTDPTDDEWCHWLWFTAGRSGFISNSHTEPRSHWVTTSEPMGQIPPSAGNLGHKIRFHVQVLESDRHLGFICYIYYSDWLQGVH